jgi:hypothetical protein
MKKLSILLIGLLLVAGFAFGSNEFEGTPTTDVDITASVTWGVDLNTNYTGFMNAGSYDLELWWLNVDDEVDFVKEGTDGLYGYIKLDNAGLKVDGGAISLAGTVSAKIVVSPVEILIYSAPGFAYDKAAAVDDMNVAIALGDDDGGANGGITIKVPVDPVTVSLKFASDGDWLTNTENDYAIGSDIKLAVDPVTLNLGLTYGFLEAPTLGVSALVELALDVMGGIDVSFAFDGVQPDGGDFDFDLAAGTVIALTEDNDDDDSADITLDAHIYLGDPDTDLDVAIGFAEPEAGGLMDMLYATVTIELLDLLEDTLGWTVDVSGGYDTGDIDPYFGFGFGSDEIVNLKAGVALKAGFTGIDSTTITIDYTADDLTDVDATLTNDVGIITVKAAVSF